MKINNLSYNIFIQNNKQQYVSSKFQYSFGNKQVTDTFETINKDFKTGTNVNSLGTVVLKCGLYNIKSKETEQCLLLCQSDDNCCSYKLIKNKPGSIKKLSGLLQQDKEVYESYKQHFYFSPELLEKIKKSYPEIYEIINDLYIAEMGYTKLTDKNALAKLDLLGYSKIDKTKDIVCIQNYINHQKEYKNATYFIKVSALKKLFKETPNIIIKASAFGDNPVSPINLYLRQGFIPLDATLDDINKQKTNTPKGKRINPDYHVIMYLPENAVLHKLIEQAPLMS